MIEIQNRRYSAVKGKQTIIEKSFGHYDNSSMSIHSGSLLKVAAPLSYDNAGTKFIFQPQQNGTDIYEGKLINSLQWEKKYLGNCK